jgi:hypothetical protein
MLHARRKRETIIRLLKAPFIIGENDSLAPMNRDAFLRA